MTHHELFDKAQGVFSERERLGRAATDSIDGNELPPDVRGKIVMLLRDDTGDLATGGHEVGKWYDRICRIINRSTGEEIFPEHSYGGYDPVDNMHRYIESERRTERVLNAIELLFGAIDQLPEVSYEPGRSLTRPPVEKTVGVLNNIFQQHGLLYRFESGKIVRIDSQLIHAETVRPALTLLASPAYAGANEEYMRAHEHYRHGRYEACLVECAKSFESVMKIICTKRGWEYNEKGTASVLIAACITNKLVPAYAEEQLNCVAKVLASGTPVPRNKPGGAHGQGGTPTPVPQSLASFALHTAAANILFLVESEKALPSPP